MAQERAVPVERLDALAFKPYGRAVLCEGDRAPTVRGEGWTCWFPMAELRSAIPVQIGLVRTEPRPWVIEEMERHPDREEWVFALDRPLIQAVALSDKDCPACPDAEQVHAVLLEPGEGVILARGTWHAPGLPFTDVATLYGFVLAKPADTSTLDGEGRVRFARRDTVRLVP